MVRQWKGDGGFLSSTGIDDNLPNREIIPRPGKISGMIWIAKHFQTLLMSALIAVSLHAAIFFIT